MLPDFLYCDIPDSIDVDRTGLLLLSGLREGEADLARLLRGGVECR
jgi:hypothetical protein